MTSTPVHAHAETVGTAVAGAEEILVQAGVPDALVEARDMIATLLDVPRFWPATHSDDPLEVGIAAAVLAAAGRRARGAPFAYAVGRAAFRHLTLEVDERVLIPRQETELLVEEILRRADPGGIAVDIGTGSGAIALALASEGQFDRVIASDVSIAALDVARANGERLAPTLRCPVEFRHGSLAAPLAGIRATVLVSNPPYIAYDEGRDLPAGVRDWEPPVALMCGDRGLAVTRGIVREGAVLLQSGGLLAFEVDCRRAGEVAEMVATAGHYVDVSVGLDLTGRERFVFARRAEEKGC